MLRGQHERAVAVLDLQTAIVSPGTEAVSYKELGIGGVLVEA